MNEKQQVIGRFISIDPGKDSHVCVWELTEENFSFKNIRKFESTTKNIDRFLSQQSIVKQIDGPLLGVAIEGQYIDPGNKGRKGRAEDKKFTGFIGLVQNSARWIILCERLDIPIHIVHPASWQSKVPGVMTGKSKRAEIKEKSFDYAKDYIDYIKIDPKPKILKQSSDSLCIGLYFLKYKFDEIRKIKSL